MGGLEPAAVVQAGLIGHGWMKVWLPGLLTGREDAFVRAAPMAHAGELLGLLLVERPVGAEPFTPEDERGDQGIGRGTDLEPVGGIGGSRIRLLDGIHAHEKVAALPERQPPDGRVTVRAACGAFPRDRELAARLGG